MRLWVNILGWDEQDNSAGLSWVHSFPCSWLSIGIVAPVLYKMTSPIHLAIDIGPFGLGGSHVCNNQQPTLGFLR